MAKNMKAPFEKPTTAVVPFFLKRFKEANAVAQINTRENRVLGESHELTFKMRMNHAEAL